MSFGGSDWFDRECGGGRNGLGSVESMVMNDAGVLLEVVMVPLIVLGWAWVMEEVL